MFMFGQNLFVSEHNAIMSYLKHENSSKLNKTKPYLIVALQKVAVEAKPVI